MNKPILLIMAAGMGSRYGGLKQIDPIDEEGNVILDYSIYDALEAGITDIVFIIKQEHKSLFENLFENKLKGKANIHYAFQTSELPSGYSIPEGRVKPWGTAHAVMSAKKYVDGPFIVINADDYYGKQAFKKLYKFLSEENDPNSHAMVAFELEKTLTDNGHVARGVITVENGLMQDIIERTKIERHNGQIAYTENDIDYVALPSNTEVSMNIWGFQKGMMQEFEDYFPEYLDANLQKNPLKCEYYITIVPSLLIKEGKANIRVLHSEDKWYGVTYKNDKPHVMQAFSILKANGVYPKHLWQ